jgi:CheY-like chemotaxis protein
LTEDANVLHKNLPVVLLVEDSPADIDLAIRTLAKSPIVQRLVVAERGEQALALLREAAQLPAGSGRFWPSLVLLDLHTPGMSGAELLTSLKSDDLLRAIPVVVFSASCQPRDLEACYRLHANAYHVKPRDFGEYQKALLSIVEYWLVAVLPPADAFEEPRAAGPEARPSAARG